MESNRINDVQVEVRVDGQWWPGWLDPDDWRTDGGRWVALVRWSKGPGENLTGTFAQVDIRRLWPETPPPSNIKHTLDALPYTLQDCPICDQPGPHYPHGSMFGCAVCSASFGNSRQ